MIDIKNVSKWYGSFQVLTDCTTTINKGDVVVVCTWKLPYHLETFLMSIIGIPSRF